MRHLKHLILALTLVSTSANAQQMVRDDFALDGDVTVDVKTDGSNPFNVTYDGPAPAAPVTIGNGQWNPAWAKFRVAEYATTGVLAAASITASFVVPAPSSANWKGGILVDEPVRNLLRLKTQSARDAANTASNYVLYALIAAPFALDGIEYLAHKESGEAAFQVLMIDAESMAILGSTLLLTKDLVARERPYGRNCGTSEADPGCNSGDRNVSFFSGHTAMATNAAAMICTAHENLHPLGGVGDDIACITAAVAATATGALRIMADKHYFSDVMTGAAMGIFSGYVLPKLLHYTKTKNIPAVAPWVDPTNGGGGLSVSGVW
ncbi:MAG: phosphatase PAP2 family protein [Deltaproteobacteria bacterium]|nr:phosphatase PAP2 family protein [Deltaproteobacteria bacterium]